MDTTALDSRLRYSTGFLGRTARVWHTSGGTAHKLAGRIRSGTVWINRHNVFDASLPFGGYKQSGWGGARNERGGVPQLYRGQGRYRGFVIRG